MLVVQVEKWKPYLWQVFSVFIHSGWILFLLCSQTWHHNICQDMKEIYVLFSCIFVVVQDLRRGLPLTRESHRDFFMTSQPLSSFSLGYSQVRQAVSAQPHPQQLRFSLHFQSVCMSPLAEQTVLSLFHPVIQERVWWGEKSSFPTCIRLESDNIFVHIQDMMKGFLRMIVSL